MFDYIPDYDPLKEKAKNPRETTVEQTGIKVGDAVIDPETLYKLALMGANNIELADWFGTSESQIRYYFTNYLQKARASLKMKLRRAQLKVALEDYNPTMLIFLGKALLSQSENPITADDNKVLPWSTTDQDLQENEHADTTQTPTDTTT